MKTLFFDIETTGFSRQLDFIIELAGIIYDTESNNQIETFHEYIKPNKKIPIAITEITGITNEQVQNCRSEKEVVGDFIDFINRNSPSHYVGHNLDAFDFLWLKEKSEFYGLNFPNLPTQDTLKIARKIGAPTTMFTKTGKPSYKQESIAAAYGIEYDAHSAIADVEALIKIYNKMNGNSHIEQPKEKDKRRIKLGF